VNAELRPPTLDDLPALVEFYEELRQRYGARALTEGQLRDDFRRTEDVKRNYRIAVEDGRVTGYVSVWSPEPQPDRAYLMIRALPRERAAYARLLDWAEARSRENADAESPHVQASADHDDEPLLEELRARGYEFARHFFEMEIDLAGEPAEPVWPDGFTVRTFRPGDERAVYAADLEAFEDHWDPVDVTFEEWRDYFLGSSDFDPELWFLVDDGDELAGFSLCFKHSGETAGHLPVLAVRRPWRKRGFGTALLLHSFRELRRHGCEKVRLNVDAENLTGAVKLYERAGMYVSQRSERYSKELR